MRIKRIFTRKVKSLEFTPRMWKIERKFLFLPLILGDELRWLEHANILQILHRDEWINLKFTEIHPHV